MVEPFEYGDIASRAAFRGRVAELVALSVSCASRHPDIPGLAKVRDELLEMQRATSGGRDPTADERADLDAGLIAIRDLAGAPDDDVARLADAIHPVVAFYEDWPTDDQAALAASGGG